MPEWTAYKSWPKLLDVTVTGLAANQTDFHVPSTGSITSGSNVAVATNANINSQVPQGKVADAFLVVVTPVIQSAVSFPDCEIWFDNGSDSQRGYQVFDVSYPTNMLPRLDLLQSKPDVAQIALLLGRPTRDVLRENAGRLSAGGPGLPNLPSLITGYKVTESLTLHVASAAGWSNPIVPLRVEVYADMLNSDDLAELGALPYDGTIIWDVPPFQTFQGMHTWPGRGTIDGWRNGPGGPGQTGTKVNRRIGYAYNAQNASGLYVLSEKNGVQGVVGNVSSQDTTNQRNQYHDLGEVLTNSRNATFIDRVGFNLYNPGDQAYVSWRVDGQTVPQETNYGVFVTANANRLAYGHDSTTGSNGGRYQGLANVDRLARILMYRNSVAPAFQPVSGTINAGNASFAYAGVKVEVS